MQRRGFIGALLALAAVPFMPAPPAPFKLEILDGAGRWIDMTPHVKPAPTRKPVPVFRSDQVVTAAMLNEAIRDNIHDLRRELDELRLELARRR